MGASIAAQVQMNTVLQGQAAVISRHGITGFVGSLVYREPLSAVLKHFRHEWQAVEASALVERGDDLCLAADFDHFTYSDASCRSIFVKVHRFA